MKHMLFKTLALALPLAICAVPARAADSAAIATAQKEGHVVWYTTLIVNQAVLPLKAAFEKKYPGVTLD